ncbi:MAG: ABC transporter ATP-binding protein [Spirochaetales bacterium]|nr:ABC transporter ATP-binding protein [Spirochaetales bacterium]
MIEIIEFTRRFGSFTAIENMNLQIRNGIVFGLLGPNGAGKTTTVKTITGAIKPSSGKILINGKDVVQSSIKAKQITGYVPENPSLFNNLTGKEYLTLLGNLYHIAEKVLEEKIDRILTQFELYEKRNEQILSYSKGMTQKLVIASAILHNPEVLILDEPLTGLDAKSSAILKEIIRSFARQGKTVLFSSHILDIVEKLCDEIAILFKGCLLATGTSRDIMEKTGSKTLEEGFIKLTGETDIAKEAADIVAALE